MTGLPPARDVNANDVMFEGYTPTPDQPAGNVDYFQTVSLDYLRTMGIPVVKGRGFERTDVIGGPVVLVNERLEQTFFTTRKLDAIGHRLNPFYGPTNQQFTIVGVVGDVKQGGLSKKTGTELYFLNEQVGRLTGFAPGNQNVVVRGTVPTPSWRRPSSRRSGRRIRSCRSSSCGRWSRCSRIRRRVRVFSPRCSASSPAWRWRWRRSVPTASSRTR
jgi:hypothetical protein